GAAGEDGHRYYSLVAWVDGVGRLSWFYVDLHRNKLHWAARGSGESKIEETANALRATVLNCLSVRLGVSSSNVHKSQSVGINRAGRIGALEREAAQRGSRLDLEQPRRNLSHIDLVRWEWRCGSGLPMDSITIGKYGARPSEGADNVGNRSGKINSDVCNFLLTGGSICHRVLVRE